MTSQADYYSTLTKTDIFSNPQYYPWNCLLYYKQFTQSELIAARPWIEIIEMVKYQKCCTFEFVKKHFEVEVDESDILTWEAVNKYVQSK
jgi:hypothetical protein